MYMISSIERGLYIRLDSNGKAETCSRQEAQKFSRSKASNVLTSLPKTLRKFDFSVVEERDDKNEKNSIQKEYIIPDSIQKWAERVKNCNSLVQDALKRKDELVHELSKVDKELSNILHTIEIENWKNGCEGYKIYKESKVVLEKRRPIKDELLVVRAILDTNMSNLTEDRIFDVIEGLKNRKFEYRDVDL